MFLFHLTLLLVPILLKHVCSPSHLVFSTAAQIEVVFCNYFFERTKLLQKLTDLCVFQLRAATRADGALFQNVQAPV